MNKRRYIFLLTLLGIVFAPLSLWSSDSTVVWKTQTIANGISAEMPGYPSNASFGPSSTTICLYKGGTFMISEIPTFITGNDPAQAIKEFVESEFSPYSKIETQIKQIENKCGYESFQVLLETVPEAGKMRGKMEMIFICADKKIYQLTFVAPSDVYNKLTGERNRFFNSLNCEIPQSVSQPVKGNQLILWIGLPLLVIAWLILRKRISRSQEE